MIAADTGARDGLGATTAGMGSRPKPYTAPFSARLRDPSFPGMSDLVIARDLPAPQRRSLLRDLREIAVDELWKYRELLYELVPSQRPPSPS